MKTTLRSLSIVLLLSISSLLYAQQISVMQAINVAKNHLAIVSGDKLKSANINRISLQLIPVLSSVAKTDTLLFIVNDTINNSFVIVAGDVRIWPIIGYSLDGRYNENDQPPAFTEWMENKKKEIEYVKQNNIQPDNKVSQQWDNLNSSNVLSTEAITSVEPLLQTTWDQGCYYNTKCPDGIAFQACSHVETGCVATAMAQIMKYWNFPNTGNGFHTYMHSTFGQLSADFGSTTYQWAQMPNNLTSENNAVATLMYHCGVSVDMNYTLSEGSSAGPQKEAFVNYFNYSSKALFVQKYNYSDSDWINLLKSELDLRHPIFYGGYNPNTGHAFVCDGYQNTDYFHFNWGWSGSSDGYFYLGNLVNAYNLNQWAMIQIFPTSLPSGYNGLSLSNNKCKISGSGGTDAVDILSSSIWTASSDQQWLTVNIATGQPGKSTLIVTGIKNNTAGDRTATITISAAGFNDQSITITQGGIYQVSAGGLSNLLGDKLATVYNLTLSGIIDARDFKTMRDEMPHLEVVDLSNVTIAAYNGTEGTSIWGDTNYYSNSIPEFAFMNSNMYGKYSLTSITLPSTITSIGQYAFSRCFNLNDITIPPSVISIGYNAFSWFSGPIYVDANNLNYSSSDGVLYNKAQTTLIQFPTSKTGSFNIPNTVDTIGHSAFEFSLLTSVGLPESVKIVEDNAFYMCNSLTSVVIPSTVTKLGNGFLAFCPKLSYITVGWSVPPDLSSYNEVFNYVNKATCILHVPLGTASSYRSVSQWQDFLNIVEVPEFNLSANSIFISAAGGTGSVQITTSMSWTVTSDQAWLTINTPSGSGSNSITFTADANSFGEQRIAFVYITIPGGSTQTIQVTQFVIRRVATVTAGGLSSVLTANELSTIYRLTLAGTIDARDFKTMRDLLPNLSELDLSQATIAAYTGTEGTKGTSSITYPANSTPKSAFYNSTTYQGKRSLTTVLLPNSTTIIGDDSFARCAGLSSFTIPSSVKSIEYGAFSECTGLTSVVVPSSVISIGFAAFSNCSGLTSFVIPPSITFIDAYAFQSCTGLTSIFIPATVTNIQYEAFSECGNLNVDAGNPNYSSVDGILFNKTKTTIMHFPFSKTGNYYIPASVLSIDLGAFRNCRNLTSVHIPSTITSIGSSAFYNCTGLQSIYAGSISPVNLSASSRVFDYVDKTSCVLHVQKGAKVNYAAANQWMDFVNIVEMPDFTISSNNITVAAAEGSTASVEITTSVEWNASSDQAWLTVNPSTGIGNKTLDFTANANPLSTQRTAIVIIYGPEIENLTITVTQYGLATGVDEAGRYSIDIYPNPAKEYVIINNIYYSLMNDYWLRIVDELGKIVFITKADQPCYKLSLSYWTVKGIYVLQVYDTNNSIKESKKIIIQ